MASLWWATAPGTPELEPSVMPSHTSRVLPTKPERATVPAGFDRRHIEVKFVDELDIGFTLRSADRSADAGAERPRGSEPVG